tara:strand:- start:6011 stop:6883 length:873 start_codon:yes stop_codon:yes gene_type:complete
MKRKGIILAGGLGSRLYPITKSISKQLLPIYDKPMIFYPLTTLMLAGIREILIITTPRDKYLFQNLIGNGDSWGMKIEYKEQQSPGGLAQAYLLAEDFIGDDLSALILGDNIFHGHDLANQLSNASIKSKGATIFAYPVADPERYGILEFCSKGEILSIEEKPKMPRSNYAVTGIYFFDQTAIERTKQISPSARGELEITDLINKYLVDGLLNFEVFGRGFAWFDTGKFESLHEAGLYIRTLESRQGLKIACPEEIAWRLGWIDTNQLEEIAKPLLNSGYGKYLLEIINK